MVCRLDWREDVALGVFQVFARMSIQRRWRAWLTDPVVSRWLTAVTINSILSAASPRICGLPPTRRWIRVPGATFIVVLIKQEPNRVR
jgi:hypothetical protein